MRFVNTPTTETWSKVAATMGDVASWAARETETRFDSCAGGPLKGPEQRSLYERFQGFGEEQNPEGGGHGELEACAVDELWVVCQQQGQTQRFMFGKG
jgi:Uma2 family endonuclease